METVINIKAFDAAWLALSKEEIEFRNQIKEQDDIDNEKYKEGVSFAFDFDVLRYTTDRNTKFKLDFDYTDQGVSKQGSVTIEDVTIIEFVGKENTARVIVSNRLFFGDFEANKSGGKQYLYIYLDGNFEYQIVNENVWLSKSDLYIVFDKYPDAVLKLNDKVTARGYFSRIPIPSK